MILRGLEGEVDQLVKERISAISPSNPGGAGVSAITCDGAAESSITLAGAAVSASTAAGIGASATSPAATPLDQPIPQWTTAAALAAAREGRIEEWIHPTI